MNRPLLNYDGAKLDYQHRVAQALHRARLRRFLLEAEMTAQQSKIKNLKSHRIYATSALLFLCAWLLMGCVTAPTRASQANRQTNPPPSATPIAPMAVAADPACPLLDPAEAATILGTAARLEESNNLMGIILTCVYAAEAWESAVQPGLAANYGVPSPQQAILDDVYGDAPDRRDLYQQAQVAISDQDAQAYLESVLALAQSSSRWVAEARHEATLTSYYFQRNTGKSQHIYWFALHATAARAVEIFLDLPVDVDDVALRRTLTQHSQRVLQEPLESIIADRQEQRPPLFKIGLLSALPTPSPIPTATPLAPAELLFPDCYGLTDADVTPILAEAVAPAWTLDAQNGYCTFTSVVASQAQPAQDDLLPTYGPAGQNHYVAMTVWPANQTTDPLMYLAFALLDRDHARLTAWMNDFTGVAALQELATTASQRPTLSRQFLADVGDGALWYWQATSTGHHLAGVYVMRGEQRIAIQAFVAPERSEEETRAAMVALTSKLLSFVW